jgi:hypothetical protein
MKILQAAVLTLALCQVSAVVAAKPVAKQRVAKPLVLPVMTVDELEISCGIIAMKEDTDEKVTAEEKESMKGMSFFYMGRVSARTNLTLGAMTSRYFTNSSAAKQIAKNPKLEAMFAQKCADRFVELIGE